MAKTSSHLRHSLDRDRGDSRGRKRDRSRSRSRSRSPSSSRVESGRNKKTSKRSRRRTTDNYDSSSESDSSSRSSATSKSSSRSNRRRYDSKGGSRRRKKDKKHRRKGDRKKKKKKRDKRSKKNRHRSRSRSPSNDSSILPSASKVAPANNVPPRAHELASALVNLFNSYPQMSSLEEGGLPLLLLQLNRGTEYNLSHMPDRELARLLGDVFSALRVHGMVGTNGTWSWKNAVGSSGVGGRGRNENDITLLRVIRATLDQVGVTMDAIDDYERDQIEKHQKHVNQDHELQELKENANKANGQSDIKHLKRIERMSSHLLDRFDPTDSSTAPSALASELQGICNLLLEGEIVQLDGIENAKLRASLSELFQLVGLEMVEMEDDEEEEPSIRKDGEDDQKAMGYSLPENSDSQNIVTSNLSEVLRVCTFRSSGGMQGAPVAWAARKSAKESQLEAESSSDDDEGPAPMGSERVRKPKPQSGRKEKSVEVDQGGREEWMMTPGEHDFLKGIKADGLKGRTFKNEKNRGLSITQTGSGQKAEPINSKIIAEVSAIQKAYEESRGPSLLDTHREQQQQLKELRKGQKAKEWTWSREKNLDDGRRVDKNALHLVLGGASTELKSKFQSGDGRK